MEETKEKNSGKTNSSPSKPKDIKLKAYEFDPKDIEKLIKDHEGSDAKKDIKAAKKSRTAIKKKISEIKKVHTGNKKDILDFKRDMEAYDKSKMEFLIDPLVKLFDKLDGDIKSIENAATLKAQTVETNLQKLQNDFTNKILEAKTIEDINRVKHEISTHQVTKEDFDDRLGEAQNAMTSLILKASGREQEIQNAGGEIKEQPNNEAIDLPSADLGRRLSDTDLLNYLQKHSSAKGWAVMINAHTGVSVYQVDDPKAPKDLRVALEQAIDEHESI